MFVDIPVIVFDKIQRRACRGNDGILFRLNPSERIRIINFRDGTVPFFVVYRDGNAVFVKHVGCRPAAVSIDTNLSNISISPFRKRCARIILPACRSLLFPVVLGLELRRYVFLYIKRRTFYAFSEAYNVVDV